MTYFQVVLILEDDPATLGALERRIKALGLEVLTEQDPNQWATRVKQRNFGLVVTDLMKDEDQEVRPGDEVVRNIFAEKFVPIVIHSGFAGLADHFPEHKGHPFLKIEPKQGGSIARVADGVQFFANVARELHEVQVAIDNAYHDTLTLTAKAISRVTTTENVATVLPHLVRRRIAAMLDTPHGAGKKLQPFERYLVPPLSSSLLTGDIIHDRADGEHRPESCRLILSQSCDLAWHGPRTPNVEAALVALPARFEDMVKVPQLKKVIEGKAKVKDSDVEDVLKQFSSCNHPTGIVALPGVPGGFPDPLVFNLKRLELIPLRDIHAGCADSTEMSPWERIASQDSPFREQIAWSTVAQLGRPALPDVNPSSIVKQLGKKFVPAGGAPPPVSAAGGVGAGVPNNSPAPTAGSASAGDAGGAPDVAPVGDATACSDAPKRPAATGATEAPAAPAAPAAGDSPGDRVDGGPAAVEASRGTALSDALLQAALEPSAEPATATPQAKSAAVDDRQPSTGAPAPGPAERKPT